MLIDYWGWAERVDVVSNDHYLIAADTENFQHLAETADPTRSWVQSNPLLLIGLLPPRLATAPQCGEDAGEMMFDALGVPTEPFSSVEDLHAGAERFYS